ncbi:hypothetical protein HYU11_02055 [Candidatus Woesearchaeota archaeon]|nr:hypothetical protein [Candidatus Woesearchaeota archaeon]
MTDAKRQNENIGRRVWLLENAAAAGLLGLGIAGIAITTLAGNSVPSDDSRTAHLLLEYAGYAGSLMTTASGLMLIYDLVRHPYK